MPDPIHQFEIKRLFSFDLFGLDATFTNSSLFLVIAVALIAGFLMFAMRGRSLVPTRLQSLAEILYEFVAGMVRDTMGGHDHGHGHGHGGGAMRFFPLVFTIFIFILTLNMLGMIPGFFTVTSHLAVTAGLALLVFVIVLAVGFAKNGVGFLKLFVPSGVPIYVLPLVVMIEIISFLSRPISHSVRLFANMLAGHITLKVFAGFIIMLLGAGGAYGILSILPLTMATALTALEFLVAFLQAYVFAMLTCMYLNDALHPGH
ncbi:MAG: F0F1 ATP synthase subunit A [Hyphomicrobiaceae bacterium]